MTTTVVSSGHTSTGITITSGNTLIVLAGGVASNTTVSYGGHAYVSSGGTAFFTVVSSGGAGVVYKGGVASATTVSSGGTQNVYGSAAGTTVAYSGAVYVRSGAVVTNATVLSGGQITPLKGATIDGATISGTLDGLGGTVSGGSIASGGVAFIVKSATLEGTTIDGDVYVSSGAIVSALNVGSTGSAIVLKGAITTSDTVTSGGEEIVSGGSSVAATVLSGGGLFLQSGGTASGGSVSAGGTVTVISGTIAGNFVDNGDVVFGIANAVSVAGNLAGSGTIDVYDNATLTGTGTLSGGSINLYYGATLSLGTGATGTDTLNIVSGVGNVTLVVTGAAPGGVISGFVPGSGDQILLPGFGSSATVSQAGNLVTVTSGTVSTTLNIAGASGYSFSGSSGTGGLVLTDAVPCFLRGAKLATPGGDVAVEDLLAGDTVLLAGGGSAAIRWMGRGAGIITDANRCDASPVIVRAGALADGVPYRDLYLTRRHCVLVDGVLVPAELLVNGSSVVFDDAARQVDYFHVELADHAVLVANGAPAESFRDDGSFSLFDNAADRPAGALPVEPCCPVVTSGPRLEAAWRIVAARVADLPGSAVTQDPDLHLEVDGQRVDAVGSGEGLHHFRLRRPAKSLTLRSRQAIPASVGASSDQRRLGVALRQIVVRSGAFRSDIPLAAVQGGVYAPEGVSRWTKGAAVLPLDLLSVPGDEIELHIHAAGAPGYRPAV